ncbi:MAG: response regulator, partial [Candidatus Sericytochromatia bacterium]
MTKILLIDDSKLILNLLKNSLTQNGYDVFISNSAVEGAEKIISDNFDLVISNINMPEISGLDLLLWSKKNYPGLKFSVMTASATDEIKHFVSKNGAASIYEKGKPTAELLEMVSSTLSDGFYGNLKNINLFDFLNLVSVSKLNKTIVVTDPITDNKGKIYFKSGNIINAEYGQESGEKAFSDILKIDKGSFSEEEFKEVDPVIRVPFEFLMINTARILDETSNTNLTKPLIEKAEQKINILIVDDDITLLTMLGRYLRKDPNYIVDTAESAILGVEIMQEKSFDLVISDLAMPEVNGLEFLLWIKQNYPQTHVVLVSGANVTQEQRDLANIHGALKFINKPIGTLIGSSNFGQRSTERDTEAQILILTKNDDLRNRMEEERRRLFVYSQP